jgi:hypothetical protein
MNKKIGIIIGVVVLLLVVTGVVVYKAVFSGSPASSQTTEEVTPVELPPADASIQVSLTKSTTAANTVVVSVKGLAGKMVSVAYELTYISQSISQGVTGKSIDLAGKDSFQRDIYLGTCSKNVCTPHLGVSKVNLVLVFTDTSGKQSQFSKDYTL